MRLPIFHGTLVLAALILLAGCGNRAMVRPMYPVPRECGLLPSPARADDSVTVALLEPVEPEHAPCARNASEQLFFGHLYETLIAVDCLGNAWPALAASWRRGKNGRLWTFELRKDARFWDGTPVTARDVAWCWRYLSGDPATMNAAVDSVAAAGDRTLRVYVKRPQRDVPRILSTSVFAVAKPSDESYWLLGSGAYRIVAWQGRFSAMLHRAITVRPTLAPGPVIRFVVTPAKDVRDPLDEGIDLMITGDPAAIEYAATQPRLTTVALPWDATYVLLSTSRVEALRSGAALRPVSPDLSTGLARDAVRGDARGHSSPSWWDELGDCGKQRAGLTPPPVPGRFSSGETRRILYDSNDAIARGLAERIVALAVTDATRSPEAAAIAAAVPGLGFGVPLVIAEGVTPDEMAASLWKGDAFAYVVATELHPADPCDAVRRLIARAPWLAGSNFDVADAVIALADTRSHVIAAKEAFGLTVDGNGTVLITPGMRGQ